MSNIRILHLVLFSHSLEYDDMYKLTSPYYKNQNIKTYYYTYLNTLQNDFEIVDDILYIQGSETFRPGILKKTIKAFEYIEPYLKDYDYVIRSNISTIINFDLLKERLQNQSLDYGGHVATLHWLDKKCGIIDETHWNTKYVLGTSIILSTQLVKKILIEQNFIRYDLIDDVAIGVLINDFFKEVIPIDFTNDLIKVMDHEGRAKNVLSQILSNKYIFYRNKSQNRKIDVVQMKIILDYLKKSILTA